MPLKNQESEQFRPEQRVKSRKDFLRIQEHGKKFRSSHFLLICSDAKDSPQAPWRLGITVTTKIDKRAARRNRLRRRIREIVRRGKPRFSRPLDVVVIALGGSTELSFLDIEDQMVFLFRKAQAFTERS